MTEVKIHQEERMMSRAEAAVQLRRLADDLESGTLTYGSSGTLTVPDRLEFEFEIEREDRKSTTEFEVEVELKWHADLGGTGA